MCLLIVPGKVQSVKTENITSTSVSLSWEKPDGNASSYFIEILGDPTFNKTINTTSYIIEVKPREKRGEGGTRKYTTSTWSSTLNDQC